MNLPVSVDVTREGRAVDAGYTRVEVFAFGELYIDAQVSDALIDTVSQEVAND